MPGIVDLISKESLSFFSSSLPLAHFRHSKDRGGILITGGILSVLLFNSSSGLVDFESNCWRDLETIQIAALSTGFATIISIVLSFGAARTISPLWIVMPTRMLLNVIRTIPSLLWAILAVVLVGSNSLAGVIALSFYSTGYLAKFFSEAFESADLKGQEALLNLGAGRIQAFQYGLWPNLRPIIWSHCLWMLEYNVRSASIIGYVGAGGIGLHLKLYAESADSWNKFSMVLLCMLLIVSILDLIGEKVRKSIREKLEGQASQKDS